MHLGLTTITQLLERLGNPQHGLRAVHVAGTNGKGSTIAFMGKVLECAGYTVGYFTSPALERVNEQIRVGGCELSASDYQRLAQRVQAAIDAHPAVEATEFEALTALALLYFAEMSCDVVLLEVGLGGCLDATNAIDAPDVAVICPIDFDHEAVLGNDLAAIAREKAGIIKPGSTVVSAPQHEPARAQIEAAAHAARDHLMIVEPDDIVWGATSEFGQYASLFDYEQLYIGLLGRHQVVNAATALAALRALSARGLSIAEEHIRTGFAQVQWPGRLEILQRTPLMLIDGAHNSNGAEVLAQALQTWWPERKAALVMGVLKDKNYPEMIRKLAPVTSKVFCIDVPSGRSLPARDLAAAWEAAGFEPRVCPSISAALDMLEAARTDHELGCACGSLYFLGAVRRHYMQDMHASEDSSY